MDVAGVDLAVVTQDLDGCHGMKSWAHVDGRYFRNSSFFDGLGEGVFGGSRYEVEAADHTPQALDAATTDEEPTERRKAVNDHAHYHSLKTEGEVWRVNYIDSHSRCVLAS